MIEDESWLKKYSLAQQYYEKHGDLMVPQYYYVGDIGLGYWIMAERFLCNSGELDKEKIEMLNQIGIKWDYNEDSFDFNYNLLKEYYENNGNANIDKKYTVNNIRIGEWLNNQKSCYKNGRLTDEKIEKLNMLDLNFNSVNLNAEWSNYYELLEEYYNEFGNIDMPINYSKNGYNLYKWFEEQKKMYNEGSLDNGKIRRLNLLGAAMGTTKRELEWDRMYGVAKKYFEECNNLLIKINCTYQGEELGNWLSKQRKAYDKGVLSEERIEQLNKINMVWDRTQHANFLWEAYYSKACEFYKENGNLDIPNNVEIDGMKVGKWLSEQRNYYVRKALPADYINRLNELGIVWVLSKASVWDTYFEIARKKYERDGNLNNFNSRDMEDIKLKPWLAEQRKLYKRGYLSQEKICKLDSININWFKKNEEELWNEKFELVQDYYNKNGNLDIKSNALIGGYNLNNWLVLQRREYNSGELVQEKIEKLNSIGMVWNNHEYIWNLRFQMAQDYYKENGNLLIPRIYVTNHFGLGQWIDIQRNLYNTGKLEQDKIEKLNSIGMVWSVIEKSWKNNYKLVKDYYEEHFNLNIPINYKVNSNLIGLWLYNQREAYQGGGLSQRKIDLLNEISPTWLTGENVEKVISDYNNGDWYAKYKNVVKEIETKGWFQSIKNNAALKIWLQSQCDKYDQAELTIGQVNLLNELGYDACKNKKGNYTWEDYYERMVCVYSGEFSSIHINSLDLLDWEKRQIELVNDKALLDEDIEKIKMAGLIAYGDEFDVEISSVVELINNALINKKYADLNKLKQTYQKLYNYRLNKTKHEEQDKILIKVI